MHLSVMCVRKKMHERVPILLVIRDTTSESRHYCVTQFFRLVVGLRMIRVVARCLAPRSGHNIAKNLFTNCGPSSVSTNAEIPSGTIQLPRNISAMCVDNVLDMETGPITFE